MSGEGDLLDQSEIEALFSAMGGEEAPPPPAPKAPQSTTPLPSVGDFQVKPFQMSELKPAGTGLADDDDLSLIADVDLNVRVELGRTRMYIEEVLRLREGSIIPLDKLAGDPVDIYVNGRLLARGEVLVLNDNFCVRISSILGEDDRPPESAF